MLTSGSGSAAVAVLSGTPLYSAVLNYTQLYSAVLQWPVAAPPARHRRKRVRSELNQETSPWAYHGNSVTLVTQKQPLCYGARMLLKLWLK